MISLICPKCQYDNMLGTTFCQKCGSAVSLPCPRCHIYNFVSSSFCGTCGVKLSEASYGIPHDEIGDWIEVFSSLGWIEPAGPKTASIIKTIQPPFEKIKEPVVLI